MHIVVIGVGGVGGYFGARLIEAGYKVSLLCRGAHKKEIEKNGLKIKSVKGDFEVVPYKVTDSIAQIDKADIILLCTKSWQVSEASAQIIPLLHKNTLVIPLQNGADNADKVCKLIDPEHVLGGYCNLYSKIEAPGIINHFGHEPELLFGELSGVETPRVRAVEKAFAKANFKTTVPKDIQAAIWKKFMFIVTVSGLGGLTRVTIREMYETPETRTLLEDIAIEVYAVAKAKGIRVPETAVADCLKFISRQPLDATASTQRDLMEGRPSEVDNFNGYIVRQGKQFNVPTPINQFIYSCLQPMERKARD